MAEDYPGSRNLILQALKEGDVPADALEICLSSVSNSTIQQYNAGLKQWWSFKKENHFALFDTSVPEVLRFFTFHFKKGASFSTLNTYRAALGQILSPSLTTDFRIKRFFKGAYSLRPPHAKYNHTWDPSIVLSYVKNLKNDLLSLKDLTMKLALLLALATGQRVQTLASIELDNIVKSENRLEIKITKKLKTSGKGKIQPTLLLPYYTPDENICPAGTLLVYLRKTEKLRNECKSLFITYQKPFHMATTQTIARWIKAMLKKSGLNTDQFTAHSTRHASTSAAARKGVSYDDIRLAAGWTKKSSTFANFYNRPVINVTDFASTVLSC